MSEIADPVLPPAAGGADEEVAEAPDGTTAPDTQVPFYAGLAVIAVVALGIRLFWVLVAYRHFRPGPDALLYHWQGWLIADGRGFIDPVPYYYPSPALASHIVLPGGSHPPLYGTYLGIVSWLGFRSIQAHRLASCLLGTGAVVVIGLVGRKAVSARVGLVAAAIAAVYANLWINDGLMLSESLTALLVAGVLLAAYRYWRAPTRGNALWLGLAFGLTALSRAEILMLAPLLAIPLILFRRDRPVRSRYLDLGVVTLATVVTIAPWVGYNLARFDKPSYMTSDPGRVLAAGSCDAAWHGKFIGWYASCPALTPKDAPRTGDASDRDVYIRKAALHYIRGHLSDVPSVVVARVGRLWDVYRPAQTRDLNATTLELRTHNAALIAQIQSYLLFALTAAGLVIMRRRRVPVSPVIAPIVVVSVAAAIFYGLVRYRVTADPGIVLASAVACDSAWRALVDRRARSRRAPGGASVIPA